MSTARKQTQDGDLPAARVAGKQQFACNSSIKYDQSPLMLHLPFGSLIWLIVYCMNNKNTPSAQVHLVRLLCDSIKMLTSEGLEIYFQEEEAMFPFIIKGKTCLRMILVITLASPPEVILW